MKMKSAIFPTVLAIVLAFAGLGIPIPFTTEGTPWLVAHHTQVLADGKQSNVDNLAFFLWGQQYTVVGKTIQTKFTPYDWRDFPFYSMAGLILAIASGILALISSRGIYFALKGKELRLKGMFNPLPLLVLAMTLVSLSALYLYLAANATIIQSLQNNNYIATYSFGLQFMIASAVAFFASSILTYRNMKEVR